MKMRRLVRRVMIAAAALAVPVAVGAQDPDPEGIDDDRVDVGVSTIDLEARAGVALPVGDLTHYSDPGFSLGLGAAWWLTNHLALRVDGDLANLRGDEGGLVSPAATPDLGLYHYGLGLEMDLPGRAVDNPWSVQVNAGAGATTFDTEEFIATNRDLDDLTQTYPNVNAGAELGRKIGENLLISLSGQVFYTFLEDNDLGPLTELRTTEPLDAGVSLPITLSIRWDMPPVTRASRSGN